MNRCNFIIILAMFSALLQTGCGSDESIGDSSSNADNGKNSSMQVVVSFNSSAQCPNGGNRIFYGIDENGNGVLDESEYDGFTEICNGEDGVDSLIAFTDEASGSNCPFGGFRVDSGLDIDRDGILDAEEISETRYFCTETESSFEGLVYFADAEINGVPGLYRATADGGNIKKLAAPEAIYGSISGDFQISPNRSMLAFQMQKEASGQVELYVVSLVKDELPIKVSGTLVANGNVQDFKWAPNSSRLVFRADKYVDETYELITVLPDGTGTIKISGTMVSGGDVYSENDYAWAPDSSRIAFSADLITDGIKELFTTNPDGTFLKKINNSLPIGGMVQDFKWAPDSSKIAVRGTLSATGVGELYTASPTGGITKVSGAMVGGGDVVSYSWAPDSSRVLYSADQEIDGVVELYVVQSDGFGNLPVSGEMVTGGGVRYDFQWSNNSEYIAYRADQSTDDINELYTVKADGTENRKVSGILTSGGDVNSFSWAPDSSRICYHADQDTDNTNENFTVRPDGTGLAKINGSLATNAWNATEPAIWAPNSSRLVYQALQDHEDSFELYSVFSDGSGNVKISGSMVPDGDVQLLSVRWSPDSSRISYIADQSVRYTSELFTVFPDGSDNTRVSGPMIDGGDVIKSVW